MLPPGRRRAGAMSPTIMLIGLFLLFATTARAAVVGIDFGTLNIKAALVKPGIPLDIVLTKDSKRKETAALAFKPNRDSKGKIVTAADIFPERAYGGDALALQGRFPSEVFPNLKLLLGLQPDEEGAQTIATYKDRYPALQVEQAKELGTTVFKSASFPSDASPFSVEELVGMELASIKRNAENMAGKNSVVEDAVITIPPFYTADERRAIVKAANYAGLNVMSLISDGLAVGLDYAKTRTFPEVTKGESPEYHLVFDMGAGSTSATLLRFQSKSVKDIGRFNKTVQEVAVQGVGYDRSLGGDALNQIILDELVTELTKKSDVQSKGTTREDIQSNGRVMARLYKEAERARQVLSANTDVNIGLEEILPDVDFRTKLTRSAFEKLAADFTARVEVPITKALDMAKLSMKDVKSIILHGGALRTPFVQAKLESVVDDQAKLRSSVNADESAVFGAAFKAAGLSPSFKVKEIRDSDVAVYATSLTYVDNGSQTQKPLFESESPVGSGSTTKQVSFKDKQDFAFGFVQNVAGTDRAILRVTADNLTETVTELNKRAGCAKDDMNTKFSIKLGAHNGLPDVIAGSVSCETDETVKSGSVGDSVKGWLGLGKKKDQEPLVEGLEDDGPVEQVDATPSSSASASGTSTSSEAASETPKKRVEVIPLKWFTSPEGLPQPDPAQLAKTTDRLKAFDDSDRARLQRDEAQNVLESFTYKVRDFLENKENIAVSTDAEREQLSARLQTVKDWTESTDLQKETTATLKEKLQELKSLVDPINTRKSEGISRPGLVSTLQKNLDDTKKLILKAEQQVEKAKASASSAASAAASSATAAPSSDADDLEEPEASTATPSPSSEPNPLASLDLSQINETYEEVSKWLIEKLAEQKKLKPNDNPVLLVKDLQRKAADMKRSMDELAAKLKVLNKPKPKPKPSPKPKASKKPDPAEADEPVPAETTVEVPEGAEEDVPQEPVPAEEPPRNPKGKGRPVKGDESIEDMLNWAKKGEQKHDEL
ncbi:Hypoxia up-regulated protein 1 [Pseudocercospora fuligena]|uniref:Hypoxia up-regulated protein 1 n=1 Tax=Pseudocercospora fuligena TaxID=685502 RepID=A0A8H6VFS8_9PEZI|nr:Hypoxia up-regulated protein 1 [Pseudocercospora fuligena]